jgi:ribosome modulation factor
MSAYQKQLETIKAKGASAYQMGQAITACPYITLGKQGRKFKRIWLAGYCEARDYPQEVSLVESNRNE